MGNKGEESTAASINSKLKIEDIIIELGPHVTHELDTLKKILKENSHFSETNIFKTLLAFANKSGSAYAEDPYSRLIKMANQCLREDNFEALEKISHSYNNKLEWNVENFLKACNDAKSRIEWKKVLLAIDCNDLTFTNQNSFNMLFEYFKLLKNMYRLVFPHELFFNDWKNLHSQIVFLNGVFSSPKPESVFFNEISNKSLVD